MEAGTWGEWVSGIGTLLAVAVALVIALLDGKRANGERRDLEASQARLVRCEVIHGASVTVFVTNYSNQPIFDVSGTVAQAFPHPTTWNLIEEAKVIEGHGRYFSFSGPNLNPGAAVPSLPDRFAATVTFTDANGLAWVRTQGKPPRRYLGQHWYHPRLRVRLLIWLAKRLPKRLASSLAKWYVNNSTRRVRKKRARSSQ